MTRYGRFSAKNKFPDSHDNFREFNKLSKEITKQKKAEFTCVCGKPTDNQCPKCLRPNCLTGEHLHVCPTSYAITMG